MIHIAQTIQPAEGSGQDRLVMLRVGLKVVVAIADGAGGRSGGAEAADFVVQLVKERAESLNSQADCERILADLDKTIASDKTAGETTAIVSIVSAEEICGASVGDSGAWFVKEGSIDDLTLHQIRKPFLGTGAAIPVGFNRAGCDGIFLVATDGLLKYTSREKIAATLQQADFAAAPTALVSLVRYSSGALPDDVTISLCRR